MDQVFLHWLVSKASKKGYECIICRRAFVTFRELTTWCSIRLVTISTGNDTTTRQHVAVFLNTSESRKQTRISQK